MPCPAVPNPRVRACGSTCAGRCPVEPRACVLAVTDEVDGVVITIGAGADRGIATSWRASVLRGDADDPLPGGSVEILRIGAKVTIGRAHVLHAMLETNPRVKLTAPD